MTKQEIYEFCVNLIKQKQVHEDDPLADAYQWMLDDLFDAGDGHDFDAMMRALDEVTHWHSLPYHVEGEWPPLETPSNVYLGKDGHAQ